MGTDLTWIVERRHEDGAWEAVMSEDRIVHLLGRKFIDFLQDDPRAEVADRSYTRYAILSGVRGVPHPSIEPIVHDGLPANASGIAREMVRELHNPGWFSLPMIEAVIPRLRAAEGFHAHSVTLMEMFLRGCRQVLANEGNHDLPVDGILWGRIRDDEGTPSFPDVAQASNHARLASEARAQGLRPLAEDTVRFVIAYSS